MLPTVLLNLFRQVHLQDSSSPTLKTHLLFRFGMTGCFKLVHSGEEPKHAHLRIKSRDGKRVFCFVDSRRFGRWEVEGEWGGGRGPDPMYEYEVGLVARGNICWVRFCRIFPKKNTVAYTLPFSSLSAHFTLNAIIR